MPVAAWRCKECGFARLTLAEVDAHWTAVHETRQPDAADESDEEEDDDDVGEVVKWRQVWIVIDPPVTRRTYQASRLRRTASSLYFAMLIAVALASVVAVVLTLSGRR